MTEPELWRRLTRIEGMVATLLRAAEVDEDERDLDGEIRAAYRRGYLAGRAAKRRGSPLDVEGALQRRRKSRRSGRLVQDARSGLTERKAL